MDKRAASQDELARYQQQQISQPLGGEIGVETRFEKNVEIGEGLGAVRILMMHGSDADLDLHLLSSAASGPLVAGTVPNGWFDMTHDAHWKNPGIVATYSSGVIRCSSSGRFHFAVTSAPADHHRPASNATAMTISTQGTISATG